MAEKTLYSIYDPETRIIKYAVFAEEPPENSSTILLTELWAKPQFNEDFTAITNIATLEEQAAFEAAMIPEITEE